VAAVALIVLVAIGFYYLSSQSKPYVPALAIQGAPKAPNLALTDQDGRLFNLSGLQGKVILIYFGYTNCPDVCPVVMQKFADLYRALGGDSGRVALILVTTDPSRDNPQAMKSWLGRFDSRIIGLTGTGDQLLPVWREYGVAIQPETGSRTNYFVDHTDLVLAIDKGMILRFAFTPEMPTSDVVAGTRYLLGS